MREAARAVMRAAGVLVGAAGIVHLAIIPIFMHWFTHSAASPPAPLAEAAMLLNHTVVGVLLLPVGVSLWAVAQPLSDRQKWAAPIALSAAGAVLALPLALVFAAKAEMLEAPAFAAAVIMISAAAAAVAWAVIALLVRRQDAG